MILVPAGVERSIKNVMEDDRIWNDILRSGFLYEARRRRRLWDNAQRPLKEVNGRLGQSSGCPDRL